MIPKIKDIAALIYISEWGLLTDYLLVYGSNATIQQLVDTLRPQCGQCDIEWYDHGTDVWERLHAAYDHAI